MSPEIASPSVGAEIDERWLVRRRYETPADRETQRRAMALLEACWGVEARDMPPMAGLDMCLFGRDGERKAWVEYKRRHNLRNHYRTLAISASKVETGRSISRLHGVPFLLVIEWDDGLYWLNANGLEAAERTRQGRMDRGDRFDIEVMAHFPVSRFRLVESIGNQERPR